jgi:hypothetical protein
LIRKLFHRRESLRLLDFRKGDDSHLHRGQVSVSRRVF